VQKSNLNLYGAINTSYIVGAIVAGWFFGGPLADFAGRRAGMAAGAFLVIIATFMQAFAPKGNIGVFIGGRVIIGLGQGLALSTYKILDGPNSSFSGKTDPTTSCRSCLHQ
jgi:MFS family permease